MHPMHPAPAKTRMKMALRIAEEVVKG